MEVTIKKVVLQPAVAEVSKDVVVLEMSKREAAALFALWNTSDWEFFNASVLRDVLGNPKQSFISDDAYRNKRYGSYDITLTPEAQAWVKSF